ncbi:MAG: M14 family metallopeptidase [Pseudomonadota bacterium]|nr:M14 family metallopeptidase [Pseudomonadota bacterium]
MQTDRIELIGATPGQQPSLRVLRFGHAGAGPKAAIQAALHADEIPAMLVAHHLRSQLEALDAAGQLIGQVVLLPYANPIGLAQHLYGQHHGRFDLKDGVNFNRRFADLGAAAVTALNGRLGADPADNVRIVRQALRSAVAALVVSTPAEDLKRHLLRQAVDADIVLDLHCDGEAVLHLYGLTPQHALCMELGALLGARAILLANVSGDSPFDEACSRPWLALQQAFPAQPLPLACFSTTVELRGQTDTSHALAQRDAAAIIEFLRRRGVVAGKPVAALPMCCEATPLAASESLKSDRAGVVVFHREPGEMLAAGTLVAEVVDVDDGSVRPLLTQSAGVLYARSATRWATPGQVLAKVAGSTLVRSGNLLSP